MRNRMLTGRFRLLSATGLALLFGLGACSPASHSDSAGESKKACPPPQEATGVTEPVKADMDLGSNLKLADSGFKLYEELHGVGATFGFVVENSTDMVLYNGVFEVSFIDQNGDNTLDFLRKSEEGAGDEWASLDELTMPVIMPGEHSGVGGKSTIWASTISPEGDEDSFHPDEIDYEKLEMEVDLVSGEWWPVKNDKYRFISPTVSGIENRHMGSGDEEYVDGTEMKSPKLVATVDYPGCAKAQDSLPSNGVAFDDDHNIVGGSTIYSQTPDPLPYKPGKNYSQLEEFMVPEGVGDFEVFPYAPPVEPALTK